MWLLSNRVYTFFLLIFNTAVWNCAESAIGVPVASTTLTVEVTAPLEFPKNNSKYHFIRNSTILEELSHLNNTEVDDLNKTLFTNNVTLNSDPPKINQENINVLPKDQTEDIQTGGNEDTRDDGIQDKVNISDGQGSSSVHGQLAAILAGVTVLVGVGAYFALLAWKRYLVHRYGNREMLVNEDDFNDPNDLNHFSL